MEGIGDTIRISLAADPTEEIKVGWDILKGLRLRARGINLIVCPGCARQNFDVIKVANELDSRLEDLDVPMDLAVIGCVVNGPGEAKEARVGFVGGKKAGLAYIEGKGYKKISNESLTAELEKMVREQAKKKLSPSLKVTTGGTDLLSPGNILFCYIAFNLSRFLLRSLPKSLLKSLLKVAS